MNLKITSVIGVIIVSLISAISVGFLMYEQPDSVTTEQSDSIPTEQPKVTKYIVNKEGHTLVETNMTSLFKVYGKEGDFIIDDDGRKGWYKLLFEYEPYNTETYYEVGISHEPQNTIVIYPEFTLSAYEDPGFYTYFGGYCDTSCLTTQIKNGIRTEASGNAAQVLSLLGYDFITDSDVDKYPEFIKNYDKVILLHNEYVTKKEFDAITNHPYVIYLYPNALYAEITANYDENTISLVRGHGYPEANIANGFDWEFENTPFEYDHECLQMEFYPVDNGWMLNCFPEWSIHKNIELLQMIKEL